MEERLSELDEKIIDIATEISTIVFRNFRVTKMQAVKATYKMLLELTEDEREEAISDSEGK